MKLSQKEIKQEVENLSDDYNEVKETWKEERHKGENKTKWLIKKYKNWILIALTGLFLILAYVGIPEIPKWVSVGGIAFIIGATTAYIPAKKLANKFVKDDRIPILAIKPPDKENSVEYHRIPREMLDDIMFHGSPMPVNTQKGRGFIVDDLSKKMVNGELKIGAIGTDLGSMGVDYRRDTEKEIKKNRELLAPRANKYETLIQELPFMLNKVKQENTQNIIEGWENLQDFGGNHGSDMIDKIEKESSFKDTSEMFERLEDMENKENGDKEELKEETRESFELQLGEKGITVGDD